MFATTGVVNSAVTDIVTEFLSMGINQTTATLEKSTTRTSFYEGTITKEESLVFNDISLTTRAPVAVLGILTNLLSIATFLRMRRSVTSTYFILSSCIDVCYLLVFLPSILIGLISKRQIQCNLYFLYLFYITTTVAVPLQRWSICVTMLISIDRCFVLAFPVKARALAHVRRPRLYVLVIGICIFLMRLERLLKFRIAKVQGPFEQCTAGGAMVVPTNTYLRNMELFKYLSLANYILFSTIPVVISAASSVFLLVVLCKKSRSSATIKSNKSAHENDACTTELQPGDPQQPTRPELAAEVRLQHASQPTRPRTLSLQSGDVLRQETVGTRTPKRENPQDFDQQSLTPTKTLSLAELSTHASATLRGDSKRSSVPIAQSKPSANRNAFFRMRWQQSVSVLVYTILSTLLASPDLIMTVITFVIPEFQKYQSDPYLVRSLLSVFYILDTINSAMNFYVYFATGSTFRKELRNLLCEMVHCSKKWPQ